MHAAGHVGAVDAGKDRLVLAGSLADVGVEIHSCRVWPCKSCIAWPSTGSTASSDSVAPFMLPGTLRISACPLTPASPRDSTAIGVLAAPERRMSSEIPGTS